MNHHNIASLIDLTCLDSQATSEDISHLAQKGTEQHVAALCVLPQHLDFIPKTTPITRVTVVNFPTGNEPHHLVLQAIDQIKAHHQIDEIDYVFPYSAYLNGDTAYALTCSAEIYQRCKQHGLILKVILETGALPSSDVIYQLSRDVINSGCDFLKTSTGKTTTGATIPAATAMLSAIIDSKKTCGIKLSGGIKTIEQAESYIQLAENMMNKSALTAVPTKNAGPRPSLRDLSRLGLGPTKNLVRTAVKAKKSVDKHWFRIGASGLLDILRASK